jgi:hypothetical protein
MHTPVYASIMVYRLPSHVLTLVLRRLEAGEPILKIHRPYNALVSTLSH